MKTKIAIKENNKTKISAVLDTVQQRSRVRTIDVEDVFQMVYEIEKQLDIPKKYMIGIKVHCDYNAQNFPNAYKYIPESTQIMITREKNNWTLYTVSREKCQPEKRKYELELTEDAKTALIDRFKVMA